MKLTFKKGKGDKIHISVDGEYVLTVDEGYFVCLRLKNGQEISEEEFLSLSEKINHRRAYNAAVSLLARRDHSEKELFRKLCEKGYAEGAETALERLKNEGYVDDLRFAVSFSNELIRLKHYGKRRVEQELYKKGVSRDDISEALCAVKFEEDALHELIRRKYIFKIKDDKSRQKTIAALMRLGYGYSEIKEALNCFCDNMSEYEVYDE